MRKLRRPFDLTRSAQEAALASLDDATEIERRASVTRAGRARLEQYAPDLVAQRLRAAVEATAA